MMCANHTKKQTFEFIIKLTQSYISVIFNKLENVSLKYQKNINIGQITSSLTLDFVRIYLFFLTNRQIIITPLLFTIYSVLFIIELNWIGAIGIVLMILLTFFLVYLNFYNSRQQQKKFVFTDERNKLVSTSISGIKSIKFNNWEKIILDKILGCRTQEMKFLLKIHFTKHFSENLTYSFPSFIGFICFSIHQFLYNDLTLERIFYLIMIIAMLNRPLKMFVFSLYNYYSSKVISKRLKKIIEVKNQTDEENIHLNDETLEVGEVKFENATFSYQDKQNSQNEQNKFITESTSITQENNSIVLENIDLKINKGELIAIIGKVGAGKTSFLKAIQKSLFQIQGKVSKNGKISIIPQQSFLLNTSVKENIIFGNEEDQLKLKEIIRDCDLASDLKSLPSQELTEIGERGVNLSGGQKQRINIARALYQEADIYLIDDCLSALDSHVGKKIFYKVFKEKLKGKTRIMSTHSLHYLSEMDRIIFLHNGKIHCIGKFEELLASNEDFNIFILDLKNKIIKQQDQNIHSINESFSLIKNQISSNGNVFPLKEQQDLIQIRKKGILTQKEKQFQGLVDWSSYGKLINNGNKYVFMLNLLIVFLIIAAKILADFWISLWVIKRFNLQQYEYFLIYLALNLFFFIFGFIGCILFSKFATKIAYKTFRNLIELILKKQITYFDITPLGQLLNLTSQDTDNNDFQIFLFFYIFLNYVVVILETFVLIAINSYIILPVIFLFIYFSLRVFQKYLKTAVELIRLYFKSFSPLLSMMDEIYNGLAQIRGQDQMQFFKKRFVQQLNLQATVSYHDKCIQSYTFFLVDFYSLILVTVFLFLISLGKVYKWNFIISDPNFTSLSLNYLFSFTIMFAWFILIFGELIKFLASAQRLLNNVDQKMLEKSQESPKAPENWPSFGDIIVKNVSMRYRPELDLAIKNISFEIKGGEKIGIVGRTGSGKSSTILLLSRLLELDQENDEHFISFDNVKIYQLGTFSVRKILKVIPQDSFIIKGSLRENIDPFQNFSNEEVIQTLKKVFIWESNLLDNISDDEKKLEYFIETNGNNLSQGQKQQICIARALIKIPKILLIDEATSSIDPKTDGLLQKLIQEEFYKSTVITIAHRIDTIITSDRIIVMDQGSIIEIGSPQELIEREHSVFKDLIKVNGEEFFNKMKTIASNKKNSIDNQFQIQSKFIKIKKNSFF